MNDPRIEEWLTVHRDGLLTDTLPFWQRHAVDEEEGGFLFCLDRDGTVVDTDKGLWQHGRFTWLLATLHHSLEGSEHHDPRWLELARHGITFLEQHGFAPDGRMLFQVTREGAPLRRRRYVFTEAFAAMAFAAWSRASGDADAGERARQLLRVVHEHFTTPGMIPPKVDPGTRPMKGLSAPMILLGTAQALREALCAGERSDTELEGMIDDALLELERDFVHPELEVVLENVGPKGEVIDHFDGRTLNPGHALEAAWFVLAEAWHRDRDPHLSRLGCEMVDWMWRRGWDEEHGGILYFRDLHGGPVQEYWHDMKFWWPHNEALLATLLAWRASGEERFLERLALVHDWAHRHFHDPQYGEWFGYLHRDGRLSVSLKGNLWKGPFHLPRMQWVAWQVLEGMRSQD